MADIRLENISRRYGQVVALDKVSLTIEDGTFTSIFGPPGAGKSVLLRVLLGLERPDEGRIYIDGRDVTDLGPAERNLAMVFQNLALFPQLSARDNILFPLRRRKMTSAVGAERLALIAQVLNISHILDKRPAQLSGGERQRVAIGRALIRDASAWMMDEPIAALDARMRDAARIELKRLQRENGNTFIYVTHDCDEAMSVADKMIILNQGKVIQNGTPDEIYMRPSCEEVAALVGMPRINILDAEVADGKANTVFGSFPFRVAHEGAARFAVRPEALLLSEDTGLKATVTDIERLGAFAIVSLSVGDTRIRLIGDGVPSVKLGELVGFEIVASGVHVFEPGTGARLEHEAIST